MTSKSATETELAAHLNASLLKEKYLQQKRGQFGLIAADSPLRGEFQRELDELEERWSSEAPARATKAAARRLGFIPSKYGEGWIRRNAIGRWENYTAEKVAQEIASQR